MTDINKLLERADPEKRAKFLETAQMYLDAETRESGDANFLDFVHTMWPTFIDGAHHK